MPVNPAGKRIPREGEIKIICTVCSGNSFGEHSLNCIVLVNKKLNTVIDLLQEILQVLVDK